MSPIMIFMPGFFIPILMSNRILTVTADAAQTVNVSLCSVFGTVVKNLGEVSLADGDNNLEFNASLLRGVYVVKMSGNGCARSKTVTYK